MKILYMSDIHDMYNEFHPDYIEFPAIDVILIAGDITNIGRNNAKNLRRSEIWMEDLSKLAPIYYIPGNHDMRFRGDEYAHIPNVTNVLNKKVILPNGMSLYGVSMSPCYNHPRLADFWDFMTSKTENEWAAYDFEPVDIILSHSPPYGVRDEVYETIGNQKKIVSIGSKALLHKIVTEQPKLVICGHIHERPGAMTIRDTIIVNSAMTWGVAHIDETSVQLEKD